MIMAAMAPAMNPIIIDQMICSIGIGRFEFQVTSV
jgi:hypothetical protein